MSVVRLVVALSLAGVWLALSGIAVAGQLDATWVAPTTNSDGSPLVGSLTYRVYWQLFPQTPCPGTQFNVTGPDQTTWHLGTLTQGMTYNVQVTAVNAGGLESACSLVASAAAGPDAPLPIGTTLRIAFVPSPSGPTFIVTGLTPGQIVTGLLRVSAVPSGFTVTGVVFTLRNSANVVVSSNAEGGVPYCFIGDPGSLPCYPFDTTTIANGAYTMTVTGGGVTTTIPFTVSH